MASLRKVDTKLDLLQDMDDYIRTVVNVDQEGARFLAAKCAPTLRNSNYVQILREGVHGIAVLRVPQDHFVVVHSACGEDVLDLAAHVFSLVRRLVQQAQQINATPLGLANVVDWNGNEPMLEVIGDSLVKGANHFNLPILNGENAVLGDRLTCGANVSGTMISMVPKSAHLPVKVPGVFVQDSVHFAVFDPEGKAVFINSDGVGTKTEFYERASIFERAVGDSFAMKVDDASRIGAIPRVISDVIEIKGQVPVSKVEEHGQKVASAWNCLYIVQPEKAAERLKGYREGAPVYNVSGSVVSVIDENRLRNPLAPRAGDALIAVRGRPNPRSNGITAKRKGMQVLGREWCKLYGVPEWHETPEGKFFLEYLAEPSTVFYPVFNELIGKGLASAVFHMSGGAYESKLAKPLAREGLFCRIDCLFPPDAREIALLTVLNKRVRDAYAQWPMGTEGFVTSKDPERAIQIIEKFGLEAKKVGVVEKGNGRSGIVLPAFNGEEMYFSGN